MLKKQKRYSNVMLIGSTSEIGISIVNKLSFTESNSLFLVGRNNPDPLIFDGKIKDIAFIKVDFENNLDVEVAFSKINKIKQIDLVIVAAGYLPPENSELNLDEITKTFNINSLVTIKFIAHLTKFLLKNKKGDILYISSVAGIRPRIRNFTYGASKNVVDFYINGLRSKYEKSGVNFLILKPGYVFTKMTRNFKPAPFATTKEKVSKIAVTKRGHKNKDIYAPKILRHIFLILKKLPKQIFNGLSK
jgi:decaprenylphospho-beta-D-erythro-pentofuranosid-2-ulose 2-reductase